MLHWNTCPYSQTNTIEQEMSKEEKEGYGPNFCKKIEKGRQCPGAYAKFLLRFGDIFAKVRTGKGKSFMRKVVDGLKIGEVITPNMEAFMRTILIKGCSHDWPKYLNSERYQKWSKESSKAPVVDLTVSEKDEDNNTDNATDDRDNSEDMETNDEKDPNEDVELGQSETPVVTQVEDVELGQSNALIVTQVEEEDVEEEGMEEEAVEDAIEEEEEKNGEEKSGQKRSKNRPVSVLGCC